MVNTLRHEKFKQIANVLDKPHVFKYMSMYTNVCVYVNNCSKYFLWVSTRCIRAELHANIHTFGFINIFAYFSTFLNQNLI